jgi:ferric-dicitrate binding protein FerR (iron transport regulator)
MQNNSENNITSKEFAEMNSEDKILKMASGFVPPKGRQQKEILDAVLTKIEGNTPSRKIGFIRYLQAAAAVLILLALIKVIPNIISAQQVKTKFAEQNEIVLPDGSDVVLNADSKIEWNKKKFINKRYLSLYGEAYFDVKKGAEFIIETKNGKVEILGTQLNVFSRGDDFWVSCISGKVRVSSNQQQQIIYPGEWVKLNDSELVKSKSESILSTALWKEGVCHFEQTKLNAIFAELERQFDIKIQFTGDGERKATIDFSNRNLQEALDVVCIPMELNYEVTNKKKVIITEKE